MPNEEINSLLDNMSNDDSISLIGHLLDKMYPTMDIDTLRKTNNKIDRLLMTKYKECVNRKWKICREGGHLFSDWQEVNNMHSFVRDYEGDSHYEEFSMYERVCSFCGYIERTVVDKKEAENKKYVREKR